MLDDGFGAGYFLHSVGRRPNRNIFGAIPISISGNTIDDTFRLQPLRRFDVAIPNKF